MAGFSYTQNRELSWLKFNERVLEEAYAEEVPLYERLKFIAIFTSNLDEFFMVRVGSLYDMSLDGDDQIDNKTGLSPSQQLERIYHAVEPLYKKRDRYFREVENALRAYGIADLSIDELKGDDAVFVYDYWRSCVLPVLSPQIVDDHHPFPFVANKVPHVAVELQKKKRTIMGLIPMPAALPSLLFLPGQGIRYVHLEEVICRYAEEAFPAYPVLSRNIFCVTRNADISPEDEEFAPAGDFREKMKKLVKQRSRLAPVRLECAQLLNDFFFGILSEKLGLTRAQIYATEAPFTMSYVYGLSQKFDEDMEKRLCYRPFTPQLVRGSLFEFPRGRDVLLSYPYESMQPFLRLVRRAANDPGVTSIQITIYRLAKEAKLIDSLCLAAENGKEVLVLIELRARFDEQNNIDWSERLETAGCRVIYGFEGFKVHSKVCLITRLEHGNPRYVTQIATGNYNEKTAAQYTDLSLITADQNIGHDAAEFFRNMAIGNLEEEYKTLMVAPRCMKSRIMELIDEEIKKGRDGQIIFKVNSVTDLEVINKLSEASCAGVRIMMLVRGICCLLPGVPGYTENIRVFSIVGRYLEHSRIYSFGAGSEQKLYISSADLMTRNMQRRVEVAVPIYAPHIRERVNHILDIYFRDTAKARELKSDGNYERFPDYRTGLSAQEQFMAEALENADTEKPRGEGWLHRKVREKVTRWYRSLTSDLD
ncbi:MAG TPA: polyphosphate kinase 1 [Candidatus Pullichristensenella excrementipullorum]|nr:polyphosphate kinase 1 [Candidatus Pullichristensenella excrementipullorum]